MTATILDLTSRLAQAQAASTCEACARDTKVGLCYPHRLAELAKRLRGDLERHDGELLISADELHDIVTDALGVLHSITSECLVDDPERKHAR